MLTFTRACWLYLRLEKALIVVNSTEPTINNVRIPFCKAGQHFVKVIRISWAGAKKSEQAISESWTATESIALWTQQRKKKNRVHDPGCSDFLVNVSLCPQEKTECFNVGNGTFCPVCSGERNVVSKILLFELPVLYLYNSDSLKG